MDTAEVPAFLQRMAALCSELAIVETEVSLLGLETYRSGGLNFRGVSHYPRPSQGEREEGEALWAPLGSPVGFDHTRSSLCNALSLAGFTSVFESHAPSVPHPTVRSLFVAVHGDREPVLVNPLMDQVPVLHAPEERQLALFLARTLKSWEPRLSRRRWLRRVWHVVPGPLRQVMARRLHST